jgi:hypothetical protein
VQVAEEQRWQQQQQKKLTKKARKKARRQAEQQAKEAAAAAATADVSSAQGDFSATDRGVPTPAVHPRDTAATAAAAAGRAGDSSKACKGSPKATNGSAVQQGSATQGSRDGAAQGSQRSTGKGKGKQRNAVEAAAAKGGAGSQAELVPTVKKLLGLPVSHGALPFADNAACGMDQVWASTCHSCLVVLCYMAASWTNISTHAVLLRSWLDKSC